MEDSSHRVGIITFHRALNYGAVLQAYALQQTIAGYGHSCDIIDYVSILNSPAHDLFRYYPSRYNLKYNLNTLSNIRSHVLLRWRFARFLKNRLSLSRPCHSHHDLCALADSYQTFVTGSDQVWNPAMMHPNSLGAYFLDFPVRSRRVAYAPSFGVSEVDSSKRLKLTEYLRKFDHLSVREASGCNIVKEMIGREVPHVLDPTLFLSAAAYDGILTQNNFPEPYILVYPMEMSEELIHLAIALRQRLKLPLIAIVPIYHDPQKFLFADKIVFDAGPLEFLGWLKNARFVCTNSFHGTVFSIIFKKTFLNLAHSLWNSRSYSLLEKLGLLDRQFAHADQLKSENHLLLPIDYQPVMKRLQPEIEYSRIYLRRALTAK